MSEIIGTLAIAILLIAFVEMYYDINFQSDSKGHQD
jgi:hypothetical protein